jgi:hypothetical protein
MKLFYVFIFYILCRYFVFGHYSCREVDDCVIDCLNIPPKFIYNLKNISSPWFPVLQDDGNCYLHNKFTNRYQLF